MRYFPCFLYINKNIGKGEGGMKMKPVLKPYRAKRVSRKTYRELREFFENAPSAPVEQLKREAAEFEKMMLARRASRK